ncbi:uncharacterized protein SPAPADRAFT_62888 [Spathaspora passalidarum NRRL Y-27907]|uniref:NAD(P)-binding domain-containing protein n=1 Tax=Spathaspora passalidarum (strain NRRL Y-27907 / 11-Y1) TaxID=619300 RepID=G3ATM2_SPAPN|nr:uncharacterized protein SPAPADRAFT_62888 [Spathaspora passalidarum NRRL Y-27907]EGW30986.1 hypothetical protein SPAPADRAFT_62888 [Spathaspora passalidarum NRRL Y-27907]
MTSAFILGSTGLVGLQILKHSATVFAKVTTVSRRQPQASFPELDAIVEPDTSKWPSVISESDSTVYFSAFGTNRAAAGSGEKFKEIDYGINYECAKAAKQKGMKTCVLISSTGASASSPFLYFQTKGQLEKDIIDLKFERTIILRPGMLLGERDKPKGLFNDFLVATLKYTHGNFLSRFSYAIYGEELGMIAVSLANEEYDASNGPIVKILGGFELTELAKKLHNNNP